MYAYIYTYANNIETQNGWGGKGPLEVISSDPLAQAGTSIASCPGPYPYDFWRPPRKETPQPLWKTYSSALSPTQ